MTIIRRAPRRRWSWSASHHGVSSTRPVTSSSQAAKMADRRVFAGLEGYVVCVCGSVCVRLATVHVRLRPLYSLATQMQQRRPAVFSPPPLGAAVTCCTRTSATRGATHTALCIYDESGTKMGDAKGTGTNYYVSLYTVEPAPLHPARTHVAPCAPLTPGPRDCHAPTDTPSTHQTNGIESVVSTIMSLVAEARRKAGLTDADTFAAMGFCMAGFAEPKAQAHLITTLTERHPSLSRAYKVVNDSVGSVYSASANGGVCVIAGTGSIANLITAKGNDFRSGGWGHMIGDGESARLGSGALWSAECAQQ